MTIRLPHALLLLLALLAAWIPRQAAGQGERIEVLRGFYAEKPHERPRRIDFAGKIFMLDAATVPIDRLALRDARFVYADQFPDGFELFRDDMEAFHYMIDRGGVAVLLCGPDANKGTVDNINYLGTRFGFAFSGRPYPRSSEIVPVKVGEGPLGGDVWLCVNGSRGVRLDGEGWNWHYRSPHGDLPVAASKRIGEGLLVLMGTYEVNRTSEGRAHNALSLLNWAASARTTLPREGFRPTDGTATGRVTPVAEGTPRQPTTQDLQRVLANPSSDRLADRLRELRWAYGLEPGRGPAESTRTLLNPVDMRPAFPAMGGATDMDGNGVPLFAPETKATVVDFFATWEPSSRELIGHRARRVAPLKEQGVALLAISIDKDAPAVRDFRSELGVTWPVVFDGEGFRTPWALALNVTELPASYLVDRQGRICAQDLAPEELEAAIRELLAE